MHLACGVLPRCSVCTCWLIQIDTYTAFEVFLLILCIATNSSLMFCSLSKHCLHAAARLISTSVFGKPDDKLSMYTCKLTCLLSSLVNNCSVSMSDQVDKCYFPVSD